MTWLVEIFSLVFFQPQALSLEDPLEDLLFLVAPDPAECLDLDDDVSEPPATDRIVSPAASANCSSVNDCARDASRSARPGAREPKQVD